MRVGSVIQRVETHRKEDVVVAGLQNRKRKQQRSVLGRWATRRNGRLDAKIDPHLLDAVLRANNKRDRSQHQDPHIKTVCMVVFVGTRRLRESTGSGWRSARGRPAWCRSCVGKSNGGKDTEVRRCVVLARRARLDAFEQWRGCALGLDEHSQSAPDDAVTVLALHGSRHTGHACENYNAHGQSTRRDRRTSEVCNLSPLAHPL